MMAKKKMFSIFFNSKNPAVDEITKGTAGMQNQMNKVLEILLSWVFVCISSVLGGKLVLCQNETNLT